MYFYTLLLSEMISLKIVTSNQDLNILPKYELENDHPKDSQHDKSVHTWKLEHALELRTIPTIHWPSPE